MSHIFALTKFSVQKFKALKYIYDGRNLCKNRWNFCDLSEGKDQFDWCRLKRYDRILGTRGKCNWLL